MGLFTGIEWADDTVNPWWGCAKVSPACAHCYAEGVARRFAEKADGAAGETTEAAEHRGLWGKDAGRLIRVDAAIKALRQSARKGDKEGRPRRVFIASMADIFEDRPDLIEPRKRLWNELHALGRRITPLILTKRPAVMAAWAREHGWPDGAWAGTTVEDQQRANERIPALLCVPARVRFLSVEPMLGPVDLESIDNDPDWRLNALSGIEWRKDESAWSDYGERIGWVICGGESGPRARPMATRWARDICDACALNDTPFFLKQWGEFIPEDQIRNLPPEVQGYACTQIREIEGEGVRAWRYGKANTGRLLDGQEWSQIPEVKP